MIVGIDLGTSNSCVTFHDSSTEIIRNAQGALTTPSVVSMREDGGVVVGEPARRQAIMNPTMTVFAVKRLVGRRFDSDEVTTLRRVLPYDVIRARNGDAWVQLGAREMSPSEVQAHILGRLRESAEEFLNHEVTGAVVTVPAFFDECQRQATRDAVEIAGMEAVRILSEPTAAALAYGFGVMGQKRPLLAVVDLGGGTLDVTVIKVKDGSFEVLSTSGDMMLGGSDFDRAIASHLAAEIERDTGVDVLSNAVALQRLVGESEKAKRTLTELDSVELRLPFLATGPAGQIDFERRLTREEFVGLVEPLIDRIREPCHRALADAGVAATDVDDVLLVGGMTRSPPVQAVVAELFQRRPSLRINPDEAVAKGAGLLTGILGRKVPDVKLVDVAARTIGMRAAGDRFVPLIRGSAPLPAVGRKGFATTADNQPAVEIDVLQGDNPAASKNRRLSNVRIENLRRAPAGAIRLAVTFSMSASGLLSVTAEEIGSGQKTDVVIEPASGLTRPEIDRLSAEHAKERRTFERAPSPDPAAASVAADGAERAEPVGFSIDFGDTPGQAAGAVAVSAPARESARPAAARPRVAKPASAATDSGTPREDASQGGTSVEPGPSLSPIHLAVVGGVLLAVGVAAWLLLG